MKEFILEMLDSKEITVTEWDCSSDTEVKGVIQLIHGSAERMYRYNEFAQYMNKQGYVVVGLDQRGHGLSADLELDELGNFANGSELMVDDQWVLNLYITKRWTNLPIIMMGHSLGSFVARLYATKHSETINKLIVLGTVHKSRILLNTGRVLLNFLIFFKRKNKKGKIFWKIILKGFNYKWRKTPNCNGSEWQTKDIGYQIDFINDELMGGLVFRIISYKETIKIMQKMQNKKKINYMKKSLPILIANGSDDPVGNFAKEPFKFYKLLKKYGYDVKMETYQDLRHEVLFETEREYVWEKIINFIEK